MEEATLFCSENSYCFGVTKDTVGGIRRVDNEIIYTSEKEIVFSLCGFPNKIEIKEDNHVFVKEANSGNLNRLHLLHS